MKVLALITAAIGSILITTQASPCIQPQDSEICSSPCIDGVFVLDVSKSIGSPKNGKGRFNLMKNLMVNTFSSVNFSPNCSRAGLILFASEAKIEFNLTAHADRNSLQKALNDLDLNKLRTFRNETGTNTAEALNLLKNIAQNGSLGVNKEDRVKIAVIITDGRPSPSKAQQKEGIKQQGAMNLTIDAKDALIKSGIYDQIYAIGVQGKGEIDRNTLAIIASNDESAFLLNNFTSDEFEEVTENIQFCNPCTSVQCPNGSKCRVWNETRFTYCEYSCDFDNGGCDTGRRCIEEDVPTCSSGQCCSPVNITCSLPDNERNCTIPCIDGVFVLDVSDSIGNAHNRGKEAFKLMKDFIARTFSLVNISSNCSRAGLIFFANDVKIQFNLDKYTNETSLRKALNDITLDSLEDFRKEKGTNTPEVLKLLKTAAQDGSLGLNMNNEDIIQVAIIITDGRPHIPGTKSDIVGNQTREAGRRLREEGIYEHIYAIGVQGKKKKQVNEGALKLITGDAESTFLIANFSVQAFEQAAANIREEFCNNLKEDNCTIEGQMYSEEAPPPEHQPTCNKPDKTYCPTAAPHPGCVCPNGTVIDEIQKRCVPLSKCRCPPQCSHNYCSSALAKSSDTLIPCMRGFPPYTEADCTNDCKKTNCQLCDYYYRSPTDDPVYICI